MVFFSMWVYFWVCLNYFCICHKKFNTLLSLKPHSYSLMKVSFKVNGLMRHPVYPWSKAVCNMNICKKKFYRHEKTANVIFISTEGILTMRAIFSCKHVSVGHFWIPMFLPQTKDWKQNLFEVYIFVPYTYQQNFVAVGV